MSIARSFLHIIDQMVLPFLGRFTSSRNKYCNVIYYHDIVKGDGYSFMQTNIDVFKAQMEYLINEGYEVLRFDDLNNETIKFKKKRILIAFDDGWRSNYSEIFEYMQAKGLKYNVFLTIGDISVNPDYLTWDMVRKMHNSGICGFGVHTFTHPDMSNIEAVDASLEIDKANSIFYQELGYPPVDFCYPFGFYSKESNHYLLTHTNYLRIYTSKQFYSYSQEGRIIFGRNGISADDSMSFFIKKLRGFSNINYTYQQTIFKLVLFVYHIFRKPKANSSVQ